MASERGQTQRHRGLSPGALQDPGILGGHLPPVCAHVRVRAHTCTHMHTLTHLHTHAHAHVHTHPTALLLPRALQQPRLYKRRGSHTNSRGQGRPRGDRGQDGSDAAASQGTPRTARSARTRDEAGRALPSRLQSEHDPADPLISDLWPPDCEGSNFCCFRPLACGPELWRPQEASRLGSLMV